MTVRVATPADLPLVRALQTQLDEPVDDLFADGLPHGCTFVAVAASTDSDGDQPAADGSIPEGSATAAAGHPVGYVHAYDSGYVAELVVAPTHRGHGYGRALMTRVLAALRSRGAAAAELEVACENDAARHLYETLGFAVLESLPDRYDSGDGVRMRYTF